MDLTRLKPLEPVITDLFVFPVDADGKPASPFERTDRIRLQKPELKARRALTADERRKIQGLAVILCVRRALADSGSLHLEPYRYRIHMDTTTTPAYVDRDMKTAEPPQQLPANSGYSPSGGARRTMPVQEAVARYGGFIEHPETIGDDVQIEIALNNKGGLNRFHVAKGLIGYKEGDYVLGQFDSKRISLWTGVRDDPFIFPAFFRTNVVAMIVYIPVRYFQPDERDWLIWATSHKGRTQLDHVGRSLRTQNPRFELLNTLHPREHVQAIQDEHENPSFVRDVALRLNVQSLFAYRQWDFVPDVMIYTNRFPVGFPNGRLLEDDVAALLAQHGDTLLLELSHHNARWPRVEENFEKPFPGTFPYLADPWPDARPEAPHHLSWKNTLILWGIVVIVVVVLLLAAVQLWRLVRWALGIRPRPTYL